MRLLPLGNGCGGPRKAFEFLFLLIVFGMTPERTEGQFCYKCDGPGCNFPSDEDINECSDAETYCLKSGVLGLIERSCLSTVKGDCFKKVVGEGCLDPAVTPSLGQNVLDCIAAAGEPSWELPFGEICFCSGSLSNEGQAGFCVKELLSAGKVNNSGLMCYKCQGNADSDCGKGGADLPKVNCPDWRLGVKIWKAACFKSKVDGMIIRDCGFKIQGDCRARYFGNYCTLTNPDLQYYMGNPKRENELQKKINGIEQCEIGRVNTVSFHSWYKKQDKLEEAGSGTGSETTPNPKIPLVGPISVVGALGARQGNVLNLPELYKDCVCPTALCNPAGHLGASGVVAFVMVFLAAAVLNGVMGIRPE